MLESNSEFIDFQAHMGAMDMPLPGGFTLVNQSIADFGDVEDHTVGGYHSHDSKSNVLQQEYDQSAIRGI